MKFKLTINCDNEAFADDPSTELAYLLGHVAGEIEMRNRVPYDPVTGGIIHDRNGNTVGKWEMK